jgi:CheY-like chemotaxis protein
METEGDVPLLLFLDLLLPGMRGDDVLKTIKASDSLRSIPVALLTGVQEPRELSFLKMMPHHFCFRLPLLESDSIDLLNRCFNYFRHARPVS